MKFARVRGLTLLLRRRLQGHEGRGRSERFGWYRLHEGDLLDVDLRVLDEALRRVGRDDAGALVDELYFSTWWATDTVTPEHAWPYYAGHLDRLAAALDDRERTYGSAKPARALAVLARLPQVARRGRPRARARRRAARRRPPRRARRRGAGRGRPGGRPRRRRGAWSGQPRRTPRQSRSRWSPSRMRDFTVGSAASSRSATSR